MSTSDSPFVVCPGCGMRVMPRGNGTCPSCQAQIRGAPAVPVPVARATSSPPAPVTAGSVLKQIVGGLILLVLLLAFAAYVIVEMLPEPPLPDPRDSIQPRVLPGSAK
ncbi:MAG: hypothetical protein ACKVP0_12990 [Pirellulaceae bacterium]